MQAAVRTCARHPWVVIACFVVVAVIAAIGALRLRHEDDVLVFLPEGDADVALFRDVSERFGSLRVALIGVAMRDEQGDVLQAENLARIDDATKALRDTPGVERVTSLTNVNDVTIGAGGVVVDRLVPTPPRDEDEHAALRARVLERELVVGTLVTADARATALLVYFSDDVSTGAIVERVRGVAQEHLEPYEVHLAGAPFAAESIYGEARRDVVRLSPIAAIVLVGVILLSFRDVVGVLLTLVTVGFSVIVVLGAMGMLGERHTALTSTLPVLLLATGSAYAVHVLGRYYLERERHGPAEAIERSARVVSRPVAMAAFTTVAAFATFLVMDVRPMRAFGAEVAAGTLVCWLTSVTLVPAVLSLVPRAPAREQLLPFGGALQAVWRFVDRRRALVLGLVLLAPAVAAFSIRDVEVKVEAQGFVREGSEVWNAQQFFEERFGGNRFVQVIVEGDLEDPGNLRELARLVDRTRAIEGVSRVESAVEPLALTIDLLGGGHRLPSTRAQANKAYVFLDGEPDIAPLMADGHDAAVVHARVRGDAGPVVDELERWIASELGEGDPADLSLAAERIAWIGAAAGGGADITVLAGVLAETRGPIASDPVWPSARIAAVRAFLASEDAEELDEGQKAAVEASYAATLDPSLAMASTVGAGDDAAFLGELLSRALVDAERAFRIERALARLTAELGLARLEPAVRDRLLVVVEDAFVGEIEHAAGPLTARVTGEPVLDRALARSVTRNQASTMVLGLVVVSLLLAMLFGSATTAIACVVPAIVTALVLGGVMGAFGVGVDLSTAMVGAILTDTASDFGMHYLWYLRHDDQPERVVRTVGPIMIVSNLLVAAGFFAFSFGESPVMHVFGGLSGATCVVSSVVTCVLVPALWRFIRARREWSGRADRASRRQTTPDPRWAPGG